MLSRMPIACLLVYRAGQNTSSATALCSWSLSMPEIFESVHACYNSPQRQQSVYWNNRVDQKKAKMKICSESKHSSRLETAQKRGPLDGAASYCKIYKNMFRSKRNSKKMNHSLHPMLLIWSWASAKSSNDLQQHAGEIPVLQRHHGSWDLSQVVVSSTV